jgi:hypothetical protein
MFASLFSAATEAPLQAEGEKQGEQGEEAVQGKVNTI